VGAGRLVQGVSIRPGRGGRLSPSRVRQIVADADLDALDAALGELRAAGPASARGSRLRGGHRNSAAGARSPAGSSMRCAGCGGARTGSRTWTRAATRQRSACARPPTGRTGPSWASISPGCGRSSTASLPTWTSSPGLGGLAEPDLEFRAFNTRQRLPASPARQLERAWDAWRAERYQRGEISQRPGRAGNPFWPRQRPPVPHARAVQETGRHGGPDGPIVTGTPVAVAG
jgi:hypothetical protein